MYVKIAYGFGRREARSASYVRQPKTVHTLENIASVAESVC